SAAIFEKTRTLRFHKLYAPVLGVILHMVPALRDDVIVHPAAHIDRFADGMRVAPPRSAERDSSRVDALFLVQAAGHEDKAIGLIDIGVRRSDVAVMQES